MPLRVAFLAAECEPWAKTGGLADVVDALARALGTVAGGDLEAPVDVFLPRYRGVAIPSERVIGERTIRVADPRARAGGRSDVRIVGVAANGDRLRVGGDPAALRRGGGGLGGAR